MIGFTFLGRTSFVTAFFGERSLPVFSIVIQLKELSSESIVEIWASADCFMRLCCSPLKSIKGKLVLENRCSHSARHARQTLREHTLYLKVCPRIMARDTRQEKGGACSRQRDENEDSVKPTSNKRNHTFPLIC